MHYRKLGNTNLEVSVVGFGAEWIGGWQQEEVNTLVRDCEAEGINIVDCWMADPAIRSALGTALAPHRDQWIIQGHIGSTWQNNQYERTRDLEKVRPAFDDLLERLQTAYVDLGMIHYVDNVDEFKQIMSGEFFAYVQELLDAKRILHVGLSTHNPDVALLATTYPQIEMIMFSINPAFDLFPAEEDLGKLFATTDYDKNLAGIHPVRAKLYSECERCGIGLTVMKPFAGGRLLDAQKSPFGQALSAVQCVSYCLNRPAVASVMGGYKNSEEMREAVHYCSASADELDYASILAAAPAHAYYGKCIYCGHCQPCVVGINIAQTNKFYDLAVMQPEVPTSLLEHYTSMEVHASACIECQSCESNCPFGVKISQQMKKTAALFGC